MCLQDRRVMCSPCPSLFIEDQMIEQVTSRKVLGVSIDNDILWSEHITLLGMRLSQKIYQLELEKIKNFLDVHSRKHFFYSISCWLFIYNMGQCQWCKHEIIGCKKRALKLVLQKFSTLTVVDYKKLNILPFEARLVFNKCMYTIVNGTAPKNINTFTTNTNKHTHKLIFPRPEIIYSNQVRFFSGGTIWNSLPLRFK